MPVRLRTSKKTGRERKDTPERVADILRFLEEGVTRISSCALAGIDERTFYRWMAEKPEFCQAVARAEADFERAMVLGIKREQKGKSWLLERRLKKDWSLKQEMEIEQKGTREVVVRIVRDNLDPKARA